MVKIFSHFSQRVVCSLVLIFSVSICQAAELNQGEHSARQWLMEMGEAMRSTSFQGDVAYLKNNQIETMQVTHVSHNGIEREHILTLSGPKREVLREPGKVTCYFLESKTKITNYNSRDKDSVFGRLPRDLKNHYGHYRFILTGSEQVTGRVARKVSIIPNDSLRYGQKIWIDSESKLPLKYELFDENGKVIEQMIFTSISSKNFTTHFDSTGFKELLDNKEAEEISGKSLWYFKKLPEGFNVISELRQSQTNGSWLEHLIISDGLVSVSVYIETNDQPSMTKGKVGAYGGINSYRRTIDQFLVTVVGEVPAETVKLIGRAIQKKRS